MVPTFIHALHVRFVVFVSFLQSGVSVLGDLLLCLSEGRDGAELIKYLVLLLEPQSGKKVLEVFNVELSLASLVDDPQ